MIRKKHPLNQFCDVEKGGKLVQPEFFCIEIDSTVFVQPLKTFFDLVLSKKWPQEIVARSVHTGLESD